MSDWPAGHDPRVYHRSLEPLSPDQSTSVQMGAIRYYDSFDCASSDRLPGHAVEEVTQEEASLDIPVPCTPPRPRPTFEFDGSGAQGEEYRAREPDSTALVLHNRGGGDQNKAANVTRLPLEHGKGHATAGKQGVCGTLKTKRPAVVKISKAESEAKQRLQSKKLESERSRAQGFRKEHPKYPSRYPSRLTIEELKRLRTKCPCTTCQRIINPVDVNGPESDRAKSFLMTTRILNVPPNFRLTRIQDIVLKNKFKFWNQKRLAGGRSGIRVIQNDNFSCRSDNFYDLEVQSEPRPKSSHVFTLPLHSVAPTAALGSGILPPYSMSKGQACASKVQNRKQEQMVTTESGFIHPSRKNINAVYGPDTEENQEPTQHVPFKRTGGNTEPLGHKMQLRSDTQREARLLTQANRNDDSLTTLGCAALTVDEMIEEGARAARDAERTSFSMQPLSSNLQRDHDFLQAKLQEASNTITQLMHGIHMYNAGTNEDDGSETRVAKRQRITENQDNAPSPDRQQQSHPMASPTFDSLKPCFTNELAESSAMDGIILPALNGPSSVAQPDENSNRLTTIRKRKISEAFLACNHDSPSGLGLPSQYTPTAVPTLSRQFSFEERSAISMRFPWLENLNRKIVDVEKQLEDLESLADRKEDLTKSGGRLMKQFADAVIASGLFEDRPGKAGGKGTETILEKTMEEKGTESPRHMPNDVQSANNESGQLTLSEDTDMSDCGDSEDDEYVDHPTLDYD